MKRSILTSAFTLIGLFLISSCSSSDTTDQSIETVVKELDEMNPQQIDKNEGLDAVEKIDSSWFLFEGRMGQYESNIVMELNIANGAVSGRYYYARHQKYLTLNGTIDKSGEVELTESYKGEKTGYLNFVLTEDIKGTWKATPDSDDLQKFEANQITTVSKENYKPTFSAYEYDHITRIYNGPDLPSDDVDVTDRMTFNTISDSLAAFYYNVVGANGHLGSINGLAKNIDGIWTFKDDGECTLTIKFDGKQANINEEDCGYYRGARAYFEGTLDQVK
ncbi:MAG: hypothetical protein ACPGVI_04615 [Crocinitomicaceae bacterium]